jgi:hypothetical protein
VVVVADLVLVVETAQLVVLVRQGKEIAAVAEHHQATMVLAAEAVLVLWGLTVQHLTVALAEQVPLLQ